MTRGAPAYQGSDRDFGGENTSGLGGAGGPKTHTGPTTAEQEGITLGNDFSLRGNMQAEAKGGDHVHPNPEAPSGYSRNKVHEHERAGLKHPLETREQRDEREAAGRPTKPPADRGAF